MEHEGERSEAMEIKVFDDDAVELIDPRYPMPHLDPPAPPRQLRSRKRLALALFLTTCVSTFLVGMTPGNGFALVEPILTGRILQASPDLLQRFLMNGLTFSGAVMLTLLAHEMGHYLQARRYGVPASLPYFIPLPISPFGTMGAVIVQAAGVANRKQMYDIAISGPIAGLVLALPITYIGVTQATIGIMPANAAGPVYGEPLLLKWIITAVHGPIGDHQFVGLTPLLFAGWVGVFVTALNLIPIGQLDGGHILYTLIGRRSHLIATLLLWGAIAYMAYSRYFAYGLMILLLLMMGPRHPPTADDSVPLGRPRVILGWLTLAFIIIGFTPTPIVDARQQRRVSTPPAATSESIEQVVGDTDDTGRQARADGNAHAAGPREFSRSDADRSRALSAPHATISTGSLPSGSS